MLSQSIYHEVGFLWQSFGLGIIITFVYDNIRVIRRVIRHNSFFVSIEDLFFWIGVAVSIFLLQHRENNGVFRWFSIIGAFLGMLLYRKTISHIYVKYMTVIFKKVGKILYLVFSCLLSPIYYLEQKMVTVMKKTGRKSKNAVMTLIRMQKIRLTCYCKMIKMTLCKHKKKRPKKKRRKHEQKGV